MKKTAITMGMIGLVMMALTACGGGKSAETAGTKAVGAASAETTAAVTGTKAEETATDSRTVTIAAAASLEKCLEEELIPMFREKYPNINIEGTYDSSGKLQTQIEEGAPVDLFFSAATKQMDALKEKGMIADESVVNLLENKIVFIVPKGEEGNYTSFEDIKKAESVALGDPESVPVGQYSKEALTNLKLWDEVSAKTSFGTNVTEVLNWVAEGSAKAGIVYATDAAQKPDQVAVVAEAPEGSVKKAIYPVGIVKDCKNPEGAGEFSKFLQSDEAMEIFIKNGFAAAK
ncbi:molybdate ABC transporter substrate-binding protein [Clostridium sp. Marseille-P2415]|uniref:molybdate ABC transporter substrate-binding protein n=1 Tax=Clostridium sp. Marseille-P2415 TaxID=1805471 RepID=UPI0009888909|nr:molybdate ABC transporter substrate-binding protein [Clostridium sp. Marseille-P2415]